MSHNFRALIAIVGFGLLAFAVIQLIEGSYAKYRVEHPEAVAKKRREMISHPQLPRGYSTEVTYMETQVQQKDRDAAATYDRLKWTYTGGCVFGVLLIVLAIFVNSPETDEDQARASAPHDPLKD